MITLPRESWTFEGQSTKEWPRWLIWTNFAADDAKILIHRLDEILVIRLGDTIERDTQGDLFVVLGDSSLQNSST